jgi:hypothetical protein
MIKILFASFLLLASIAYGTECPHKKDHHNAGINERGDKAMGFSHEKTTHHFLLKENGGIIKVEANSAEDLRSIVSIRAHLSHIAAMFSEGNFEIPMFIHDREPSGVRVMKERKHEIKFKYDQIDRGGTVILSSNNSDAVDAIHDFLRFQIQDHQTGDPLKP